MYYEMFRLWERVPGLPEVDLLYSKNRKYDWDQDKARAAAACSRFMNILNGSGLCLFGALLGVERLPVFEWLNAATGWQMTPAQYLEIGDRIQTLKQLFNLKQGIAPQGFRANPRTLGDPPMTSGANQGRQVDLDRMRRDYWDLLGWDPESGKPLPETIRRLGLKDPSDAN
jgi:aldehyde:ferredoxin oxidoreductase